MKKKYDLYVSLGGNCAARGQLQQRGLRKEALPFDNFFLRDNNDIEKFIKALSNDFKGCFLKENMRELSQNERGNSKLYQYQDMVSGYNIIHLFHNPIDVDYVSVKKTIDRRMNRLFSYCKQANNICFMLTLKFDIPDNTILRILDVVEKKFPKKRVDLICVLFNAKGNDIENENLLIKRIHRDMNDYDFYKSNIEWIFLDDFSLEDVKLISPKDKLKIHLRKLCSCLKSAIRIPEECFNVIRYMILSIMVRK